MTIDATPILYLQIILIVGKAFGVLTWSWPWVFAPMLFGVAMLSLAAVLFGIAFMVRR